MIANNGLLHGLKLMNYSMLERPLCERSATLNHTKHRGSFEGNTVNGSLSTCSCLPLLQQSTSTWRPHDQATIAPSCLHLLVGFGPAGRLFFAYAACLNSACACSVSSAEFSCFPAPGGLLCVKHLIFC